MGGLLQTNLQVLWNTYIHFIINWIDGQNKILYYQIREAHKHTKLLKARESYINQYHPENKLI